MIYNDDKFTNIWNACQDVEQVMAKTQLSYSQVTVKAYNLRKKGIYLKKMYKPKGDKSWIIRGKLGGTAPTDKPKGFATMPKDRLKEVAKLGGEKSRYKKVL